jgi:hypothetical protein
MSDTPTRDSEIRNSQRWTPAGVAKAAAAAEAPPKAVKPAKKGGKK